MPGDLTPPPSRRGALALQALASALVLAVLVHDADLERVRDSLAQADLAWLLLAIGLKALGLTLHEVRLWVSLLPWGRPPLLRVIPIGYVSALSNIALPVRGGDLLAAALLRRELGVPGPVALAAVAITGFLEAALFGVFVLGVIVVGASRWEELLGATATLRAMGTMTALTLGALFGTVALVMLSRRIRPGPAPIEGVRPLLLLRETVLRTGEGLGAFGPLALNVGLSALQVLLVVGSFWAVLPALGLSPPMPLLAVSGLIALGSVAAVVLPPSLGAGPAATAVMVLGFFGVAEPQALGFAALSWVANSVPPVVLGLGPLWRRLGQVRALLRAPGSADSPPPGV